MAEDDTAAQPEQGPKVIEQSSVKPVEQTGTESSKAS